MSGCFVSCQCVCPCVHTFMPPSQNPLNKQTMFPDAERCVRPMHRWCQSTLGCQWPHFAHLLTLWLTPSFLHAQIDTWCRGRQTGGLSALCLKRCGPAVSRLIQSNLPLSQAGTPGCSPSSSRLEARQTTRSSSTLQTARGEGSTLLVK